MEKRAQRGSLFENPMLRACVSRLCMVCAAGTSRRGEPEVKDSTPLIATLAIFGLT